MKSLLLIIAHNVLLLNQETKAYVIIIYWNKTKYITKIIRNSNIFNLPQLLYIIKLGKSSIKL